MLRWSCPLPSDRAIPCLTEFRVECLTYSRSRARPVPSLTWLGYGLPPTATIPVRRFINIKHSLCPEPWTFATGTCAPSSHHTESSHLPAQLRGRLENTLLKLEQGPEFTTVYRLVCQCFICMQRSIVTLAMTLFPTNL